MTSCIGWLRWKRLSWKDLELWLHSHLYSLSLVSKRWLDLATWFMDREIQLMKSWAEGVPSKKFECQALVSEVAVDAFSVVMGLEHGEMV